MTVLSDTIANHDTRWRHALTLRERLRAMNDSAAIGRLEMDDETEWRCARWRKLLGAVTFHTRLDIDGCSESQFKAALAYGNTTAGFEIPNWARELDAVVLTSPTSAGNLGLAAFVEPFVARASSNIKAFLDSERTILCNHESLLDNASKELRTRLTNLAVKTLVLELNAYRLLGRLDGDTPEARFDAFCCRLADPAVRNEMHLEYPVLCRSLLLAAEQWTVAMKECVTHAHADAPLIRERFFKHLPPLSLIRVGSALGDQHRGRAVRLVEFSDGATVLYKPRSLSPDIHFGELAEFTNRMGWSPKFEVHSCIDRGDYGWASIVRPGDCTDVAAVERFYERVGGYLCLLHLTSSTVIAKT